MVNSVVGMKFNFSNNKIKNSMFRKNKMNKLIAVWVKIDAKDFTSLFK